MMPQQNPYLPPTANVNDPAAGRSDNAEIPPALVEAMRQTKPWVRFFGVVGFIGCGLMVLAGLFMLALGGSSKMPGWIGLVYLPFGLLYFFPSLYLYRYGVSIEAFLRRTSVETLGEALAQQKSFWRFVGILTATILIIYAAVLVIGLVAGFGALAMSR
jgi:hypothetical protein